MSSSLEPASKIVGLLTDFGWTHYVGQMKAVLWQHCPTANIVDLSHSIPKQDVAYAAIELLHCLEAFPPGSWIIAVVDPGVGTTRSMLLVEVQGVRIVAPDNGLISLVAKKFPLTRLMALTNRSYWRKSLATTFDGRDVLASVVGHALANPDIIDQLGESVSSYRELEVPEPEIKSDRIQGHILYIDSFGNAITNVTREMLSEKFGDIHAASSTENSVGVDIQAAIRFKIDGITAVPAVVNTYAARQPGSFVALVGSSGYVEFALTNGNAARQVGLQRNQRFEIFSNTQRSVTSIFG